MLPKNAKKKANKNMQKGANAFPQKQVVSTAAESSDEDSSEDEVGVPVTAGAGDAARFQKTMESDSDEELDSEDLDESDDDMNEGQQAADSDESDEDDDDDMENEGTANVRAAGMTKAGRIEEEEDDEEEEDSDDDDDDDIQGEENDGEMDEEEDEEDESEDEEEDESDDEDDDDDIPGNKRKLPVAAASAPAKKQKIDSTATELFVRGFPQDVADDKMKKFFGKNGVNVSEIRRVKGKQFCFVELVNAADMTKALQLSGRDFKGNTLKIQVSQKKSQPETPGKAQEKTGKLGKAGKGKAGGQEQTDTAEENKTTVFVKNIAWATTEDALKEVFSGCTNVRMPKRPDGASRGFAFVQFESEEAAASAITEHNNEEVDGRELHVSTAGTGAKIPQKTSQTPSAESKTLIIRNISYDTSEEDLKDAFEDAVTCRLMTYPDTGKSKGFAFVEFESIDEAKNAVKSMNGQTVDGREIRVDFARDKGAGDGHGGRGGRGGFRGGRGGGRGGFRGGRGGGRGGHSDRGGRGGKFRGGRGGRGGRGRGGFKSKD